ALAGLALTTTVRVVDRVHHHAAHRRTDADPALGAGLAVVAQVVLVVRQLAQGGTAVDVHLARLARLQADEGMDALARGELRRCAGAANHLAAPAGLQLDVVHHRPHRQVAKRHRVAGLDGRVGAGAHFITHRHALGGQDVAALAVGIFDQRDVRGAIRVVLERLDHAGDAVLVAPEIDQAILLARPTALVAGGDAAGIVARAGLALRHG